MSRTRADLCPGALRPWPADDGLLVRLRLIGGRVTTTALLALVEAAEQHGDGRIHVTGRANLQLRGLPSVSGALPDEVLAAIEATGLLPSRSHELVRNIMVSPGLVTVAAQPPRPPGDMQGLADELDRLLCADATLSGLPARFLFVLDDGSGDLLDRSCDLGAVLLDRTDAQLRVGEHWGPVVRREAVATRLVELASAFVTARGTGASAPWHVRELAVPLAPPADPDPRLPAPSAPPPFGPRHLAVPATGLDRAAVEALPEGPVVVTPWRGLLLPAPTSEEIA